MSKKEMVPELSPDAIEIMTIARDGQDLCFRINSDPVEMIDILSHLMEQMPEFADVMLASTAYYCSKHMNDTKEEKPRRNIPFQQGNKLT